MKQLKCGLNLKFITLRNNILNIKKLRFIFLHLITPLNKTYRPYKIRLLKVYEDKIVLFMKLYYWININMEHILKRKELKELKTLCYQN